MRSSEDDVGFSDDGEGDGADRQGRKKSALNLKVLRAKKTPLFGGVLDFIPR